MLLLFWGEGLEKYPKDFKGSVHSNFIQILVDAGSMLRLAQGCHQD